MPPPPWELHPKTSKLVRKMQGKLQPYAGQDFSDVINFLQGIMEFAIYYLSGLELINYVTIHSLLPLSWLNLFIHNLSLSFQGLIIKIHITLNRKYTYIIIHFNLIKTNKKYIYKIFDQLRKLDELYPNLKVYCCMNQVPLFLMMPMVINPFAFVTSVNGVFWGKA